jgi:hypothetical protein
MRAMIQPRCLNVVGTEQNRYKSLIEIIYVKRSVHSDKKKVATTVHYTQKTNGLRYLPSKWARMKGIQRNVAEVQTNTLSEFDL